ncbi:uncharacterized protein LOC128041838 isoform X3 [Gossypium raimondii]|uniref:uncharacterized protein LOC128041838 isoform X3 n=1 Tax=Gossypium raimondii TaxID=29730 RepID=UPI00227CCB15|nr:uncharacterized protein LOC128041838 isoform X3 [Gossypium raimondii]
MTRSLILTLKLRMCIPDLTIKVQVLLKLFQRVTKSLHVCKLHRQWLQTRLGIQILVRHGISHMIPLICSTLTLPQDHSTTSPHDQHQFQNSPNSASVPSPELMPQDLPKQSQLNIHPMITRGKSGIVKPKIISY